MFARRKKSPFKGPMLSPAVFSASTVPAAFGSPAIVGIERQREGSDGKVNLGLRDFVGGLNRRGSASKRKSQIIEEEEEEDEEEENEDAIAEEEEVEEVETFPAIHLNKGERVQSITIWNDAVEEGGEEEEDDANNASGGARGKAAFNHSSSTE